MAKRPGLAKRILRCALAVLAFGFGALMYVYVTLPDVRVLKTSNPTDTAFMRLRADQAAAEGKNLRHVQRWVPYSRISQNLKRAVLVAEDDAFWDHEGVDFEQIRKSMEINMERGAAVRGASTLTQQLAKNLYLSPSRNPIRKLRELVIARRLEAELGKSRIFEIYLNVIEWGDGIWGAEAAARTYFGTSAASLNASQAALLAGAIINPRVLDPGHPTRRLLARQRMLLGRMRTVTPPPPPPVVVEPPTGEGEEAPPADELQDNPPTDEVPAEPAPSMEAPGTSEPLSTAQPPEPPDPPSQN